MKLSAVLMGSHGLTKGSLAFLNYPAQLMFKSTKVAISCKHSTNLIDHKCALFRHVIRLPNETGANTGCEVPNDC